MLLAAPSSWETVNHVIFLSSGLCSNQVTSSPFSLLHRFRCERTFGHSGQREGQPVHLYTFTALRFIPECRQMRCVVGARVL